MPINFRFSGHETFPCRYAWLPKAYAALNENERLFSDEDNAMVRLGVGKNMVRAIRFWAQLAGVSEILPNQRGYRVTPFGHAILSDYGFDPYFEDIRTLWLLHWKFSAHTKEPMFAWYFLLNQWPHPELSRPEVLRAFRAEAEKQERPLSDVTLEQHFDTFLHTYIPTRGRKGEVLEDNLDCPLTELRLLLTVSERTIDGRREAIYAFRREDKPDITPTLLAYCIADFWRWQRPNETTLSFQEVAVAPGSVGQIFKIPEPDLRDRLETLQADSGGLLDYQASAATPRLVRNYEIGDEQAEAELLASVYERPANDYFATQTAQEQVPLCLLN
ncbi:MAG: DUF4007 family protein [Abitibacteriaceae bacterium]|nr:DUF4007 family protein [Abditibacteriaceae bacterium]